MDQKSRQRTLDVISYLADSAGSMDYGFYDRIHDKRYCFVQNCFCFFRAPQRTELGQNDTYALRLLGICWNEPASGTPLEYDAGNGAEI